MAMTRSGLALLLLLVPAASVRVVTQEEVISTASLNELRLKKSKAVEKINSQIKYNLRHAKELRKQFEDNAHLMTDEELDKIQTSTLEYIQKKRDTVPVASIIGVVVDSAILAVKSLLGRTCVFYTTIAWWILGIVVLMIDNDLDFVDAFFLLGQQITTVGYGSDGPDLKVNSKNGPANASRTLAIFHGLHSMVGTTIAGNWAKGVVDKWYARLLSSAGCSKRDEEEGFLNGKCLMYKSLMILGLVLGSTLGFTFDVEQTLNATGSKVYDSYGDAFLATLYMVLITMTTVGYGDVTPYTGVGKGLSVPWMIIGTQLWGRSWEDSAWMQDALEYVALSPGFYTCEKETKRAAKKGASTKFRKSQVLPVD